MTLSRIEARTTHIDCPNCAKTAEEEIRSLVGVTEARVDSLSDTVSCSFDQSTTNEQKLRYEIERLGHFRFLGDSETSEARLPFSRPLLWSILGATLLTAVAVVVHLLSQTSTATNLILVGAVALGGWDIVRKAIIGLRNRRVDMNTLMSIAVLGAVVIGEMYEAVAVVILFGLANLLESFSLWKLSRNLIRLRDFTSDQALLKVGDRIATVSPESLEVGDIIVLREGMRIPADGIIVSGSSFVDTSSLTGEPEPRALTNGERVFGGWVNQDGYLEVRVTARPSESLIGRIMRMVDEAAARRSRVEKLVDRFARIYTPVVVGLAVVVAVVPPLLLDASFYVWFYKALVFLVISCPCALVISTPVAVTTALASASRLKAVLKGGDVLERLARTKTVAFDKTGTLTRGTMELESIKTEDGIPEDRLLQLAASLEQISQHPVAAAIVHAARHHNLPFHDVENPRAVPGVGVEGRIDGHLYRIGGVEIVNGTTDVKVEETSNVFLTRDGKLLATFTFTDPLRSEVLPTLAELRDQLGLRVGVLSGDRQGKVDQTTESAQLDFSLGELLPDTKYERVLELGDHVAMVGDGLNDLVALSGSDLSIAVGRFGNDITTQKADIILFGDSLVSLPRLFRLGRRALNLIKVNIAFAISLKFVFLLLAVGGYANIWMAVVADMGASLAVIFNSLRLLRQS